MIAKDIYGYKIFQVDLESGNVIPMMQWVYDNEYNLLGENHFSSIMAGMHSRLVFHPRNRQYITREHRQHRGVRINTGKLWHDEGPTLTREGFYVWRTFKEALMYQNAANGDTLTAKHHFIIAKVRVWGEIVHCENLIIAENLEFVEIFSEQNGQKRRAMAHLIGWPGKIHPYPITMKELEQWRVQERSSALNASSAQCAKYRCRCLSHLPPRSRSRYLRKQKRNQFQRSPF